MAQDHLPLLGEMVGVKGNLANSVPTGFFSAIRMDSMTASFQQYVWTR